MANVEISDIRSVYLLATSAFYDEACLELSSSGDIKTSKESISRIKGSAFAMNHEHQSHLSLVPSSLIITHHKVKKAS